MHTIKFKRYEDPSNEPHDRHEIKLHRKAADLIVEHSDAVFFANYKVGTVQVKGKMGMTTKTSCWRQNNFLRAIPWLYGQEPIWVAEGNAFRLGGDSRGDVEMSQLGDVEEVKMFLGEMREVLNTFIDKHKLIQRDNSLPARRTALA